ncbi:Mur ligase family protein, partial [Kitasatospora herbaricolor]|uniref:Mur ligase family protein n=1 Tax=Kitasatospora herbaricolor TaxID=68217 RepID=UPI0036DB8364
MTGLDERLADLTSWRSDWRGLRVAVYGLGVTGFSVADTLVELGAEVLVVTAKADAERAMLLEVIGAELLEEADLAAPPARLTEFDPELIVVSPGFHHDHPLLDWADQRGMAVWGDIELAWRLRDKVGSPADWIAVTGTNGKTSVVYLLNAILGQLGVVSGLSSTAERRIGETAITSKLTTPEASELHALLARMREAAVRAVAIEVSAQALSRHRVDGIVFDVVGFTNLSHDHLDDYDSMSDYFEAKLELFQPDRARRGVVTVDSDWGRLLVEQSRIPVTTLTTSAGGDAEWTMSVTEETVDHTAF